MDRARILLVGMLLLVASLALAAPAPAGVYVSNSGGSSVSPFTMNADGSLGPIACNPATDCASNGTDPEGEAISPSGRFLYVATGSPGAVSIFAIAPGGALTPVSCSPPSNCAAGSGAFGLAIAPSGRFLYVSNSGTTNSVSVFAVAADGTLTPVQCSPLSNCSTGLDPAGAAIDPTGRFLYVANDGADSVSVFAIQANGSLAPVSCDPATSCHTGSEPNGVKMSPSGRFVYVTNIGSNSVSVFAIGANGALTPVPCNPISNCHTGSSPNDLAISPSGLFLYTTNYGGGSVSQFAVGADGTLTPIACSPASNCTTGGGPDGVAIDPSGHFLYAANGTSNSVTVFSVHTDGSISPVPCDPLTSCQTGLGPNFQSVAIPPNQGPLAAVSATAARAGRASSFDARGSSDPDGSVVRYDWNFGDGTSAANAGPTPQHVYSAPGTYNASVTVTDGIGCSSAQVFNGQELLCNGSAAATATVTVAVAPRRPVVSGLSQSARRWRGGKALPKIARKRRLPLGTRFRFTLNEAASVRFDFTQRRTGRRVGHRCVPTTRKNRTRRSCKRTVSAGKLAFNAHSGLNSIRFQGRISRRVKLRAGRYTLVVTAKDSGGASSARRSISFTIVK